jgi:hypothetical protein
MGEGGSEHAAGPLKGARHRWARWVVAGSILAVTGTGIGLGVAEDLGAHSALDRTQTTLATAHRQLSDLQGVTHGLMTQTGALRSQVSTLESQYAVVASQNATLSSQNASLLATPAATPAIIIAQDSGTGPNDTPASSGFVVAQAGSYHISYAVAPVHGGSCEFFFSLRDDETGQTYLIDNGQNFPNNTETITRPTAGAVTMYLFVGNYGAIIGIVNQSSPCRWSYQVQAT